MNYVTVLPNPCLYRCCLQVRGLLATSPPMMRGHVLWTILLLSCRAWMTVTALYAPVKHKFPALALCLQQGLAALTVPAARGSADHSQPCVLFRVAISSTLASGGLCASPYLLSYLLRPSSSTAALASNVSSCCNSFPRLPQPDPGQLKGKASIRSQQDRVPGLR